MSLCLAPGSRIENLQVIRLLGQGFSGFSYLIKDRIRNGEFVLKEYLPLELQQQISRSQDDASLQFADPRCQVKFREGMQNFLAQGRTLAGLQHPHIIEAVQCFEASGTAYLQMPWQAGETLDHLLQHSGPLDAEKIKSLLPPMLDALQYLHQHSITHRDIKPANIYLTSSGTPLLLDFDSAAKAQQPSSQRTGSPAYAAPELESGSGPTGPWTDIYGLAATLYRLISGRLPATALQRLQAINQGLPDPLVKLESATPNELPVAWLDAIHHGLNLQAAQRPQTIEEWSKAFGNLATASRRSVQIGAPEPANPDTGFATEGRAWLPLVLLGVFMLGLAALVFYLLNDMTGGSSSGQQLLEDATTPSDIHQQNQSDGLTGQNLAQNPDQNRRWQEALEADTIYAYQRYRQDYPNSIHEADAKLHLARLDDALWQQLDAEGTRSAYESYLEQLPEGRHETEAMIQLDVLNRTVAEEERQQSLRQQQDHLAWNGVRMQRSIAAVDQYLRDFPDGQHLSAAQTLHRELSDSANDSIAFTAAQKLNTRKSYQAYIDAFPRGQHVTAALTAIDSLTLRPGKRFRDCDDCPDLVVLEAGTFWQGAEATSSTSLANEKPQRKVVLAEDFAIGIHEVTLAQWDACVAGGGCSTTDDNGWGRGSRPVIMVSWNDAQAYVEWLSKTTGERYRLPSESEWEYAARAGETAEWPDDNPAGVCSLANIAGNETGFRWSHTACADPFAVETAPVGSFLPNAFGLYDYLGNVAEWTLDCMSLSYVDSPADGSANNRGLCNSRVTRGGSWFSGARESRLSARFNLKAGDRNDFTGFRVVRELPRSS